MNERLRKLAFLIVPILWALYLSSWVVKLDRFPKDTYNYIVLAESLAHGRGYTIQGVPHSTFLIGYPLHLAPFAWMGLNLVPVGKALGLGFGAAVLAMTFVFGGGLVGRGEGWLAMVLLAAWPMFGRWCMAPMSEPLFAFYSLLALWLAWRGAGRRSVRLVIAAFVLGGITAVIRYQGVLLWLPLLAMTWAKWNVNPSEIAAPEDVSTPSAERKRLLRILAIGTVLFAIPLAAWLVRNWVLFGNPARIQYFNQIPEYRAGHRAQGTGLAYALGQLGFGFFRFPLADLSFPNLPSVFSVFRFAMLGLYWLAVIGGTVRAVRHRRWELVALALWVFELHIFQLFWPFREERFYMPGFPIVCILGVYAAGVFYERWGLLQRGDSGSSEEEPLPRADTAEEKEDGNKPEAQAGTVNRQVHRDADRRRRTLLFLGVLAALGMVGSPIIYGMQYMGLRVQSSSPQAQAAGTKLRELAGPHDRVATTLNPVECYYYSHRPTQRFRTAADLRKMLETQAARWKTDPRISLWIVLPDRGVEKDIQDFVNQPGFRQRVSGFYQAKSDTAVGVYLFRLSARGNASEANH